MTEFKKNISFDLDNKSDDDKPKKVRRPSTRIVFREFISLDGGRKRAELSPSKWDNVILLQKDFRSGYDLMLASNDGVPMPKLYLGKFNKGIK